MDTSNRFALVAPFVVRHGHYSTITGAGLREGCGAGTFRGQPLEAPLATVCATNDKHLVTAFIAKHFGGQHASGAPRAVGSDVRAPLGTVTARDHNALVRAFLIKYYGAESGQHHGVGEPLHTVTSKARFGLVTIHGEEYQIADIGMRMLQPHELFAAQGFPPDYEIAPRPQREAAHQDGPDRPRREQRLPAGGRGGRGREPGRGSVNRVEIGDCRAILRTLDAGAFRCCVTSPPYWGLAECVRVIADAEAQA